jgi:hypothetical protein
VDSQASSVPEESVIDEPSPCCAKHSEKSKKRESSEFQVRWVSGILKQHCQGPLDAAKTAVAPLTYPPEAAVKWTYDWGFSGSLQMITPNAVTIPDLPVTPPPR